MTYRSTDLTCELRGLVDAEPPPCALDLDAARARGLAFRRRRRAVRAGGGMAGTCLAVLLVFAFVVNGTPAAGPAVATTGTSVPAPSPATTHDPLTPLVSFGWLPPGVHLVGSSGTTISASDGSTQFDVMALAPGKPMAHQCSDSSPVAATALGRSRPPCNVIAPDVNGHAAYWSFPPTAHAEGGPGYAELVWQYAPNAWASLDANIGGDMSNDIVPTVYKVAENLRFQANSLPLPFHLPAAPAGLITMTVLWQGAHSARDKWIGVDLMYSCPPAGNVPASILDMATAPATSTFPTAVQSAEFLTSVPATNIRYLTLDGHQAVTLTATLDDGEVREALIVHDLDGVDFTLSAAGATAIADVNAAGGLMAYYHAMKVLGADSANWTTDVIG